MAKTKRNITDTLAYIGEMVTFLWGMVRNPPLEWVADYGTVSYTEQWTRRMRWRLRPRYLGFVNSLPCGCARRFGRIIIYRLGCPENHGGLSDLDLALDTEKHFDFHEE